MSGTLYIVATPIGNLGDVTRRATEVLAEVDAVLCEDTRTTRKLLSILNITTQLVSFHDHNEEHKTPNVIKRLSSGRSLALVSDAGTPALADPGYRLINAAIEAGISIVPIPGPSSLTAALSVCGLPVDRFVFEGFLPVKAGKRKSRLTELADDPRTAVFFEGPHRIAKLLQELLDAFGSDRPACVCRELTKRFEEIRRGTIGEIVESSGSARARGEYVVIIGGLRR